MGSNTGPAECKVCGERHWMRDPHVWKDEVKKKKIDKVIADIPVKVASELECTNNSEKCTNNSEKCTNIRQVGIRGIVRNLSKELLDLPFAITRNGKVIAVVRVD